MLLLMQYWQVAHREIQGPPEDEFVLCIDLSLPLHFNRRCCWCPPSLTHVGHAGCTADTTARDSGSRPAPLQGSRTASCCPRLSPRSNTAARPATALKRSSPAGVDGCSIEHRMVHSSSASSKCAGQPGQPPLQRSRQLYGTARCNGAPSRSPASATRCK